MTDLDCYYLLKPFVPRDLRIWIRSRWANRVRKRSALTWPILEAAGEAPPGWPGWPSRQPFAFVLTHDVESRAGLEKVKPLAELEASLGFRSSFNFVPQGEYEDPRELRAWLVDQGFEVGVHDLHHDGKLLRSRSRFRKSARAINSALESWGAVGFRAGFMLRNHEWFHDLNIEYDASNFDTDPFEPMPKGAATIFPHWFDGPEGRGYVELPYTLVQDSTLFLLLEEPSAAVWLGKLNWIVRKGGMALVNVHPDYIDLTDRGRERREYPFKYYVRFLEHVRERYGASCWHALPREVAAWYRESVVGGNPGHGSEIAVPRSK